MKKITNNIHKYSTIYTISILIFSLILTPPAFAETGYVSDMLILSLKEGPGRQFNTIKTLRSNTQLEILETTERYLKVQTLEGDVGWVESQYITKELPKALIIEELNKKIEQLEAKNQAGVSQNVAVNQSQNINKINELELTANNKEIDYTNKIKSLESALNRELEKNRRLETQLRNAKEESESSHFYSNTTDTESSLPDDNTLKTAMIKWFCAGAAVLIAGWFIGRSFSGARRSSGGLLD
ncbi:MAG: TIGR04211 family SH3 domain-containing protein [Desulfamplus sp.]|nr:TIGR04211 family SH3 domain-containing protein [Desulfamplus sp.]MBF0388921.1 TIGR04211 family SH3 domain-containing protein [Desulfamplus sp.]